MTDYSTDLTFFTNKEGHNLLDRFQATLKDTRLFDVLVGYFRASGFYQLYRSIEPIEKTRILIGLGIDEESYRGINEFRTQTIIDFDSHSNTKRQFSENLIRDIEESQDSDQQLEKGLIKFIQFLKTDCPDPEEDKRNGGNGKKLEIKAYPSRNIHAKVYIGRFQPEDRDYGFVITGSSNFSYSGLVANREFNVELRQKRDVAFALEQFETLWKDSVDISRDFIDTVQVNTWLNDTITPYELYLKLVYEYLQEDINLQDNFQSFLPEGYMKLKYQEEAVIQALKKLEEFNGVFIADVVGLGKTFITAQLLQQVKGNVLVICPPVLKEYWEQSLADFRVFCQVESLGKLDSIIRKGTESYQYIVVDEAHRFRNEGTQSYADLLEICRGKKIILVTATPLNNKIEDIFTQLKLFQLPKNSTIPGVPNLEKFFNRLKKRFASLDRNSPEYRDAISQVSSEIREKILKHVMVRRTRSDVKKHFEVDIHAQGLVFPEMQDPRKLIYYFEQPMENVFNNTIELFKRFRYTRYIPLLYYTGQKKLSAFEKQQQRNVGAFMKGLLVKRLESSFYAFKKSLDRFILSYENFIGMFKEGTVYISKKVNVYDLLDNDDLEKLETLVELEKVHKYDSTDFQKDFLPDLEHDLDVLRLVRDQWRDIHQDPKLDQMIDDLKTDKILKKQKLVIFTESKETGDYLYENMEDAFPGQVCFYSSHGGRFRKRNISHNVARQLIKESYDPNYSIKRDLYTDTGSKDLRILISTDVLAEGVNLHRANILVNYDLPWNPTRVLQRAGRINRLGTTHPNIYIFNFFPTSQSDAHLGLEINIKNKIQMFHDILGEDAKYLSDGEEIGSQQLFDTLNKKSAYTGEDEEGDSELAYLKMMQHIRDEQPDLFQKIKNLPKRARSGFAGQQFQAHQLLTFFRLGKLKKFYCNSDGATGEVTFFDAVKLLKCEPETPRAKIPADYFKLLEENKARFRADTMEDFEPGGSSGGRSNLDYIERRLKDRNFKQYKKFTHSDDEYLAGVRKMLAQGTIAKKTSQKIKKEIEKTLEPMDVLHALKKHIRTISIIENTDKAQGRKREVILSGYLLDN